jgi:hypothetical protein
LLAVHSIRCHIGGQLHRKRSHFGEAADWGIARRHPGKIAGLLVLETSKDFGGCCSVQN